MLEQGCFRMSPTSSQIVSITQMSSVYSGPEGLQGMGGGQQPSGPLEGC
jgi:hypothetical protein